MYRLGGTTGGQLDAQRNMQTGFAVEGQKSGDAPPPDVGTAKKVAAASPSTAAASAAQSGVRAAQPFNKGQEWLMSATPQALVQFGLIKEAPVLPDALPGSPHFGKKLYTLPNGKSFLDVSEAYKAFHAGIAESPTAAQTWFDRITQQYGMEPSPYGLVRSSQQGYSQAQRPQEPLQQGEHANGTTSLAQHERETGDTHYPARVGVREGIVNARAMERPEVAQFVMDANRRFPANVEVSRGTYADGYAPQEDLVLDEGGLTARQPSSPEAYMGAVQALNSAAQDTAAAAPAPAPIYEPAPREAGDALAQRDSQLAVQKAQDLVAKSKAKLAELAGPAPRHTNKYLAAMDEIAQHARDVQAKYQINWANPDPRERAILQRELAWEQGKVKAAMAMDKPRQEWQKMALDNIKGFMRNASDEEIASAFGPEVATARNNRQTRALGWKQLEVETKKALNEGEAINAYSRTLAAEVMAKVYAPMMEKAWKDGVFHDQEFAKALKASPVGKYSADVVNMLMLQSPVAGTADIKEVASWLPWGKSHFEFDYAANAGSAPTAGAAPQYSADADSLMRDIGE
jgi:hypothetical protein